MSTKSKKSLNYNRTRRFTKARYGIILLILLFFIITTIYLLLYTDFFLVREIEITGNDYVRENEILKASHLEKGMNILKFNKSEAENRILMHSFIKDVKIDRYYPDMVTINIVEREIACIIPYQDGNFLYIDEEGVVMEKSQTLKTYNNPLITGLEEASFIIGNPIDIEPLWLKTSILNIISILKENNLLKDFSEIHLQEDHNVQLYTNDGSVIKIGNDSILKEKIEFVKTYVSQSHPKEIVDIRHGGDAVSKPRTNWEE